MTILRLFLAVPLLMSFACTPKESQKSDGPAPSASVSSEVGGAIRKKAPPFSLPDEQGKIWTLDSFKDTVVVLHFWASWCGPCIDELPEIFAFVRKLEGQAKFSFVAISLDENWEDAIKALPKRDLPKKWISLLDPKQASSHAYGSFQFPETYLISKDQKIITKWVGPQKWDHPTFKELMDRAINSTL